MNVSMEESGNFDSLAMKYKNTVALITARGGSKGLPRKNILPVNDVPLIAYTIDAAKNSNFDLPVFVSTDDEEIKEISKKFGAEIIHRPSHLADDNSSSMEAVSHAIDWFKRKEISCDHIVLLQPTSPLRNENHINEALEQYFEKNALFVLSVFEPQHTPVKAYIQNFDGSIRGLYSEEAPYSRRQDLPRSFQPNGAIYAFSADEFEKNRHFPRKMVFPYVMSEYDSVDIDTSEDLKLVEQRLKELKR